MVSVSRESLIHPKKGSIPNGSSRRWLSAVVVLALAVGAHAQYRSIDGSGNNIANPDWGKAHSKLNRLAPASYADGISLPAGPTRPEPRVITNAVVAQPGSILNNRNLSDFTWQWGQFLDHDYALVDAASPEEPMPIHVPAGDPFFDPGNTGTVEIPFLRSAYDPATGTGPGNPRQQMNTLTSYIDASNVYGSDMARANELRTLSGGRLKTSAGNLLPFNENGFPNLGDGPSFFLAGDIRANEQLGLTAMHTLWVREHNRLADQISSANPGMSDEDVYQTARKMVGAEVQVITYKEFLPALMGPNAPSASSPVYDANMEGTLLNEFSAACYRVGHTMLSPMLQRLDSNGNVIPEGNVGLRDAFLQPDRIINEGGIEPLLRGLASQRMQEIDNHVIDDVRNFLFGPPGSGGLDLTALNIQRGRDHGLADYNTVRVTFGLAPVTSFADITSDPDLQAALQSVYGDVNNIDLWIGAISEDHLPGGSIGALLTAVFTEQFTRLRDGDRFWYSRDSYFLANPDMMAEMENTTLADVIRRNTGITGIQDNVFFVPEPSALALIMLGSVLLRRRGRRA